MKKTITSILTGVIIALALLAVVRPATVNQDSMLPLLEDGDKVIFSPVADIDKGDIVVIKKDDTYYIKRIIGLPKDHIKIKEGKVFINNKEDDQSYTKDKQTNGNIDLIVPSDKYFVMGDNRLVSVDSRDKEIGLVSESEIKGQVIARIFPNPKKI